MMTTRSADHGSFTIERTYPVAPQRVFAAWASQATKGPWFADDDDFFTEMTHYSLDFRVGGRERLEGTLVNGHAFAYDAVYHDVVDDERIIASYDVLIDGRRTSVSLMTVTINEVSGGSRLVVTEQGAFLDGLDSNDQRREGASDSLTKLGEYLESHA
jgi:uncharacterized protein YndB with AHSA1/START domain